MVELKKHVFPRLRKDLGKVTPVLFDCSVEPAWLSYASVLLGVIDDPAMPTSLLRGMSAKPFCCSVMVSSAVAGTIPSAAAAPRFMPSATLLLLPLPTAASFFPDPSKPSAVLTNTWPASLSLCSLRC
jgi:hypothetical protein